MTRYATNTENSDCIGHRSSRISFGRMTALAKRHGFKRKGPLINWIRMGSMVQRTLPFGSNLDMTRFTTGIRRDWINSALLWRWPRHSHDVFGAERRRDGTNCDNPNGADPRENRKGLHEATYYQNELVK
jgi:hypothetical protein